MGECTTYAACGHLCRHICGPWWKALHNRWALSWAKLQALPTCNRCRKCYAFFNGPVYEQFTAILMALQDTPPGKDTGEKSCVCKAFK